MITSDYELIDLDEAVINALRLFISQGVPNFNFNIYKKPLVVGSGNAAVTGRLIFSDMDAVFADESTYESKLDLIEGIDGAVLISAFGEKHAPIIARKLVERNIKAKLITTNKETSVKEIIGRNNVFVFPKNPEPYTYNTSTYMGIILSKTRENPRKILEFIKNNIDPLLLGNLSEFNSFYFIIPEKFDAMRDMFLIKFDELFGSKIGGRVYTSEQTKHGKTIVPNDNELFVSFGYDNNKFGVKRINLPLPEWVDYGAIMAIVYYFVGKIQKQNYPWYKENIENYTRFTSKTFGNDINPLVD